MSRPLPWTDGEREMVVAAYRAAGLYREAGSASCVFLRPTHEQLAKLKAGEDPIAGEDYTRGPNVWSIAWFGAGLGDQLKLTRTMLSLVGEGGVFAWHSKEDYREHHPERHGGRRIACLQP